MTNKHIKHPSMIVRSAVYSKTVREQVYFLREREREREIVRTIYNKYTEEREGLHIIGKKGQVRGTCTYTEREREMGVCRVDTRYTIYIERGDWLHIYILNTQRDGGCLVYMYVLYGEKE